MAADRSGMARACGCWRSSAYSTAMKWLLPDPNVPVRNAPLLVLASIASPTTPSAVSNARAIWSVTT